MAKTLMLSSEEAQYLDYELTKAINEYSSTRCSPANGALELRLKFAKNIHSKLLKGNRFPRAIKWFTGEHHKVNPFRNSLVISNEDKKGLLS